jgi:hypothetical protein
MSGVLGSLPTSQEAVTLEENQPATRDALPVVRTHFALLDSGEWLPINRACGNAEALKNDWCQVA